MSFSKSHRIIILALLCPTVYLLYKLNSTYEQVSIEYAAYSPFTIETPEIPINENNGSIQGLADCRVVVHCSVWRQRPITNNRRQGR